MVTKQKISTDRGIAVSVQFAYCELYRASICLLFNWKTPLLFPDTVLNLYEAVDMGFDFSGSGVSTIEFHFIVIVASSWIIFAPLCQ